MQPVSHPPPGRRLKSLVISILGVLVLLAMAVAFLFFRRPSDVPSVPITVQPHEWARTNLVLQEGRLHQTGTDIPFSGLMVDYYSDGAIRSRSAVTNGLLHGLSQGYHTNGQMQVSENFREGVSHGVRTKWYLSGVKQSEATILDGKLNGPFRRWHENGTLSEEATFQNDQPQGVSIAYYPSGFLKAKVVMEDGKAVDQTFWKDGEAKP